MPEPKSFEHSRRATRWILVFLLFLLLGRAIANEALTYAAANDITKTGESGFVDGMLLAATAVVYLSVIPAYMTLRALFAARRAHDEGYLRLWAAVTDEDRRREFLETFGEETFRKTGLKMPRTGRIFAPAVSPKTYSEMVYGKKETEL